MTQVMEWTRVNDLGTRQMTKVGSYEYHLTIWPDLRTTLQAFIRGGDGKYVKVRVSKQHRNTYSTPTGAKRAARRHAMKCVPPSMWKSCDDEPKEDTNAG